MPTESKKLQTRINGFGELEAVLDRLPTYLPLPQEVDALVHDSGIAHEQREVIQRLVKSIRALQNPQNFRCDPTHDSLRARDAALDSSRDALIIAAPFLPE